MVRRVDGEDVGCEQLGMNVMFDAHKAGSNDARRL